MSSQMIVRVKPDLKAKVSHLAKTEGKTVSEIVRELLEDYVRNRDIGSYIDDLWERIGSKLDSSGIGPGDVEIAVRDVRTKK